MQDQPRLLDDLRDSTVPGGRAVAGHPARCEFPTADADDRAGIRAGLEHVVGLGHTRIAFVSAHLQGDFRQREDAYVEFMTERFGGVPDGYLAAGREHAGRRRGGAAARCSTLPEPPTAVGTSTDLVAIGVAARGAQPRRGRARAAVASSASTTS